jgi:hypothetical protein
MNEAKTGAQLLCLEYVVSFLLARELHRSGEKPEKIHQLFIDEFIQSTSDLQHLDPSDQTALLVQAELTAATDRLFQKAHRLLSTAPKQ